MNKYILASMFAATTFLIVLTILQTLSRDKLIILNRTKKLVSISRNELRDKKAKKLKKDRKLDTKIKFLKKLSNELSLSGLLIRPSEFLFIWILVSLMPSSVFLLFSRDFIVAFAILVIGLFLPPFYMHRKKIMRIELFEKQLVDAVAIICNCLRSGLNFQQSIESIANEMSEPISKEFGRVLREVKLGNSLEKALQNSSVRLGSKDFSLIVSTVLIQRQIGGNLSEILANLAGTIKERYKIKSEIKVLTTTGRASGMLIGFMPIAILLLFMIINPNYIRGFFETSLGIGMLVTACVLEVIGFLLIRKIVNIKF